MLFPGTYTDIADRHIGIGTDMIVQANHKALAEIFDYDIEFAAGIEIAATFSTTQGQTC